MSDVVTIAGSPSNNSRSSAVLAYIRRFVEKHGLATDEIAVRDLDAHELLTAQFDGPTIRDASAKVARARAIVIATPIYKAAYSGVLKAFFDLLPQDSFANKIIYPIATGGSPNHLLAIDYSLKPLLSALGAQHVLRGLFIQDAQLQYQNGELLSLAPEVEERLHVTLLGLVTTLAPSSSAPVDNFAATTQPAAVP